MICQKVKCSNMKSVVNMKKIYKGILKLFKMKLKTIYVLYRNLKSIRFPDFNNHLKLRFDFGAWYVVADFTVDQGETYMSKANKNRLTILTTMRVGEFAKFEFSGAFIYNFTVQLPAKVNISVCSLFVKNLKLK